jgi:hypothetical protein
VMSVTVRLQATVGGALDGKQSAQHFEKVIHRRPR